MSAWYNELDPFAAAWLRELIRQGLIADGEVDTRSVVDVRPSELAGFDQCHFFAGIGVWSYALRLAGWPDDRPVWTGSCPCQPFSAAGKGGGFADERHLWPSWFHLIGECRPAVVLGEQVASKDGLMWLDLVQADLEGTGYACGAVDLCAAGVGAPHIRQRLWWVAHPGDAGWQGRLSGRPDQGRSNLDGHAGRGGAVVGLADASHTIGGSLGVDRQDGHHRPHGGRQEAHDDPRACGEVCRPGPTDGFWRAADWLYCRDGKWRPVEPGTFPLAHGTPARVGRLRGYGNALVAPLAATFIEAIIEVLGG